VCRNDELEARFIQLEKLIAQLTPEQT
ncbi:MAG: hypothetical protein ACI9LO_003561, partial [Planctomycetota bacterium]